MPVIQLDTLTLPNGLLWSDEYTWQPVGQKAQYTLTGALVVEAAGKQAGKPITLSGTESRGWVTRSQLDALEALAAVPGKIMTLTLPDGRAYQVMFRHHDGAFKAEALLEKCIQSGADFYTLTINLMAV